MDKSPGGTPKKLIKSAAEKVVGALNRADELGGEVRDWIQEKVVVDPRYVTARKRLAKVFGKEYRSAGEAAEQAARQEKARAAAAPDPNAAPAAAKGLGDPSIKAQIYGRKSCAWTGRAITILERHKVDFDFLDLDDSDHENKLPGLINETHQNTVPYIYLRGQFIGGFNALAEVERLGQLEFALMTAAERAAQPEHVRKIVITARPNTDEVAPAENMEPRPLPSE
jgi:glutaredoxin